MRKTIFITGASTGIGKATAIYFAERGWNVAATMRTPEKGADLLRFPHLKIFELDVLNSESIIKAIGDARTAFGGIDVLFNNAGYALVGAFEAMSDAQVRKQFDTNVHGTLTAIRAILPYFREKGGGIIINTTSVAGHISFPLYSVYVSTKWALEGFMESLQYELRPFRIKVKNVQPVAIKTEFKNALDFVTQPEYEHYTDRVHSNMLEVFELSPSVNVVAKKVWQAANDKSYRLRYVAGITGLPVLFLRWLVPDTWFMAVARLYTERGLKKRII